METKELLDDILEGNVELSAIEDAETFAALETFVRESGISAVKDGQMDLATSFSEILNAVKSAKAAFDAKNALMETFAVEESVVEDAVEDFEAEEPEALEAEEVEEFETEEVEALTNEDAEEFEVQEDPEVAAQEVDMEALASSVESDEVVEGEAPYHFNFVYRSDVAGRAAGEVVTSYADLAQAVIDKVGHLSTRNPGVRQDYEVARINYSASMDVQAAERAVDVAEQFNAIRNEAYNTASRTSLTASGGICAAPQRFYDFCKINNPEGLVQSFLPSMFVPRGAITWYASPDIRDAFAITAPAISETYTVANDAAGDSKTCVSFPCPSELTAQIEAQYVCLQFGNIGSMTFPEWVEHWISLSMDVHAHYVSAKLMAKIAALVDDTVAAADLTAYTGGLGVAATVFSTLDLAVADYRHDLRTGSSLNFEAIIPSWGYDMIRADLSKTGRLEGVSDAQINAWFAARGVTVNRVTDWVDVDEGETVPAPSPAQGAHRFSKEFPIIFYPRGTFVKLDMGTLDIGVVRDSTLNSTNDYQLFIETFESVAKPGCGDARRYNIPANVGHGFADNREFA